MFALAVFFFFFLFLIWFICPSLSSLPLINQMLSRAMDHQWISLWAHEIQWRICKKLQTIEVPF